MNAWTRETGSNTFCNNRPPTVSNKTIYYALLNRTQQSKVSAPAATASPKLRDSSLCRRGDVTNQRL